VIGRVGSGKSSLLYSLLNEMSPTDSVGLSAANTSGVSLGTNKGVAIVTQEAWIQQGNGSLIAICFTRSIMSVV